MNNLEVRAFIAAMHFGSFNAAAKSLHLSQPSVSQQVRRLEADLGVELFIRSKAGLVPTQAARVFLPYAEDLLSAAEAARAAVGRKQELQRGLIKLGVFRHAPYYLISQLVSNLRSQFPAAAIWIAGETSSTVAQAVQEGALEAGLVVLPVDDQGLSIEVLFEDENVVATRQTPSASRIGLDELAEQPLILYDATSGMADPTRRQLAVRAQTSGIELKPSIEVEHVELALQLAELGLGRTVVARSLTKHSVFPTSLHAVPLREPLYDTFALVTRRGIRLSRGTAEVVDLCREWANLVRTFLAAGEPPKPSTTPGPRVSS